MPKSKEKIDDKNKINYKARLERKLCLAQEIPEPIFDISDCNLKTIPGNVFVLCKVFRKEALYLQKNNLSCLSSGGSLGDLKIIKILDISSNKFSKLPDEIGELENLEVLDVSKNRLTELPKTVENLQKLTQLNLSYNNLHHLPNEIGFCRNMEVLNLLNNEPLKKLPDSLGRIHSLIQLRIDSTIVYPPRDVCNKGIHAIMQFLSENLDEEDIELPSTSTKTTKEIPRFENFLEKLELLEKLKLEKQNKRLQLEKELMEQNEKEVKMQQELKNNKKKLLADVKGQQELLEAEYTKLQEKRNTDRALLLQLCKEEEKKSKEICRILNLKKLLMNQNSAGWEKERKKEEEMLFNETAKSKALERKQTLASMGELMKEEISRAQASRASREILAHQSIVSEILAENALNDSLMKRKSKNNAELMDVLRRDEELQKSAVASLLEKSDATSWKLSQQVAIIEAHLAELTRLELSKKKLESESQITELTKNRIALTELLVNLFEQQTKRRKVLVDTIRKMESMRDSPNFWMEQYEKLLYSKSHEMVKFLESVDPKLVYKLFVNEVFQYLPLLRDVVGSTETLENLNANYLIKMGIMQAEDRKKILSAVESYLTCLNFQQNAPSAPLLTLPSAPLLDDSNALPSSSASYLVPEECVICLETKPEVLFVPCGHICCCYKCFMAVALCPLCRKPIDAAHKRLDKK